MSDAPKANPVRNSIKSNVPQKWGNSNGANAVVGQSGGTLGPG